MSEENNLTMVLGIEPDQKSTDDTKKTFNGVISLISDLAIIGKIAGDTLGNIWGKLSGSIKVGVDSVKDGFNALVNGFDSSEFNKLAEALENISPGGREQTGGVVSQVNDYIRAFQNPEMGAEMIEKFEEAMATAGVSNNTQDALRNAFRGGEGFEATKLFAQAINEVGAKGNDLADAVNLVALANNELDSQFSDFMSVMNKSSILYDRNLELLDMVNDSLALIDTANRKIKSTVTENLAEEIDGVARMFAVLTSDLLSLNEGMQDSMVAKAGNWLFQKPAELMENIHRDYETDEAFTAFDKLIYDNFKTISDGFAKFDLVARNRQIGGLLSTMGIRDQAGVPLLFQSSVNQNLNKPGDMFDMGQTARNLNINIEGLSTQEITDAVVDAVTQSLAEEYPGKM